MVFKPFSHLARQSFAKSFTHGYAQSAVAASQSSYASSTTPFPPFVQHPTGRRGKVGSPQIYNAFQNSSSSSIGVIKAGSSINSHQTDGGLAAYFAAWQQHNLDGDNEWKQFQFAKRIGWRQPSALTEVKSRGNGRAQEEDYASGDVKVAERTQTNVEPSREERNAEDVGDGEISTARDVSSKDDSARTPATATETGPMDAGVVDQHNDTAGDGLSLNGQSAEHANLPSKDAGTSSGVVVESTKSMHSVWDDGTTSDPKARAYYDQITHHHQMANYAQVPAIFKAMLLAGVTPTTYSYNALLAAAINLPAAKHQVAMKALDIYADMRHRRVQPNLTTYSTLIELLASRALEVGQLKTQLDATRARYALKGQPGRFLLASNGAEYDILAEDNSLTIALKLFDTSVIELSESVFPVETYQSLLEACAEKGRVPDIIKICAHMEARAVVPHMAFFKSMIIGLAKSGDLLGAQECFREYRTLAIAANSGQRVITNRSDDEIHTSLIRAYIICGDIGQATKFHNKVQEYYSGCPDLHEQLREFEELAISQAFVKELATLGRFEEALSWAMASTLNESSRSKALARVCIAAADKDSSQIAATAFDNINPSVDEWYKAAIPLMAMHLRSGNLEAATAYWLSVIGSECRLSIDFVEPSAMYIGALLLAGRVEEGSRLARQVFGDIRSAVEVQLARQSVTEPIDEAIEYLGQVMRQNGLTPSGRASSDLMWAMVENGGLVTPVAEQLLSGLGPESIRQLDTDDVILMMQVQSGIISDHIALPDPPTIARFSQLLEIILSAGIVLDQRTTSLLDQALAKVSSSEAAYGRPDLLQQWHGYRAQVMSPSQYAAMPVFSPVTVPQTHETVDPYASTTDHRASTIITEELERSAGGSGASALNSALLTFRNVRRAGRHPRYNVYAKLISAAARAGRADLCHEILNMARTDVPLLPEHRLSKQGWTSILDSVVGAYLTLGNREMAIQHHTELSAMGASPSANTFGLYITTLKESTRTFDEASEAVKIFQQAQAAGVEPSSFLYNALIGKLGKARRIDDCMYYFAEMRNRDIRPTSVTYGTVVNALCRVSDERFAEELFEEMEGMPNYKPRPAPYNSLMQFFLATKRDRSKVLAYYQRMVSKNIQPTSHTFKLLIDAHATLEPPDMQSAEAVLGEIRRRGQNPEPVHYAALIHAKGCSLHDVEGARKIFDDVLSNRVVRPHACLYQALYEAMVANHQVGQSEEVLEHMSRHGVAMTPYIANTLIHGWTLEGDIAKAQAVYDLVGVTRREPSTYEAMTRAFLAAGDRGKALEVVQEMATRGYPSAVAAKISDLVGLRNTNTLSGGYSFDGSSVSPLHAMDEVEVRLNAIRV